MNVAAEIVAYAAYLNAPRGVLDTDEQQLLDEDLLKARAQMERAWLENTPIQGDQVTYVLHVTRRTAGHLVSDDYYEVETEYAAREAGLGMVAAAEGGPDTVHYTVAPLKELPR